MTSPANVAAFHADYDHHPDDHHPEGRVRLFAALTELIAHDATVLYPGSYVDIGPSVWFDDVTYVDTDKRAARFFAQTDDVTDYIETKRATAGTTAPRRPQATFHHLDYRRDLPIATGTIDVLVSLYAGFITEHCTRYLRPDGLIVANNSHGDASMATLDPNNQLIAVLISRNGTYQLAQSDLDGYVTPKRGAPPTIAELHRVNRGIPYTRPAYAYVFRHHREK